MDAEGTFRVFGQTRRGPFPRSTGSKKGRLQLFLYDIKNGFGVQPVFGINAAAGGGRNVAKDVGFVSSHFNVKETVSLQPSEPARGPVLPNGYGVTRLRLMGRDPFWLFAYWEVAPDTWAAAENLFGPGIREIGKAILLFRAVGNGIAFDVEVRLEARNWYVRMPKRSGHWKAELGLTLPDGRFVLLAASNEVRLPEGRVSEETDSAWAVQKSEWEKVNEISGGGRAVAGSLGMALAMSRRRTLMGAASSWRGNERVGNGEDKTTIIAGEPK